MLSQALNNGDGFNLDVQVFSCGATVSWQRPFRFPKRRSGFRTIVPFVVPVVRLLAWHVRQIQRISCFQEMVLSFSRPLLN